MASSPAKGIKTRQQSDLAYALERVRAAAKDRNSDERKIYGGLCHKLPILVRTCGLCQTLAYVEEKAQSTDTGARSRAHGLLREHIAGVLGCNGPERLLEDVRDAPLEQYMRHTRRVLEAWVYFKRFAVSILKVESGAGAEDSDQ